MARYGAVGRRRQRTPGFHALAWWVDQNPMTDGMEGSARFARKLRNNNGGKDESARIFSSLFLSHLSLSRARLKTSPQGYEGAGTGSDAKNNTTSSSGGSWSPHLLLCVGSAVGWFRSGSDRSARVVAPCVPSPL